ncbi:hypothetical protein ACP4OV_006980 [Aristida adscensionis]
MAGGEAKAAGGAPEIKLANTPTWIVAAVCSVIVLISLIFERLLHRLGKRLLKRSKKPQYEALLKIKEELMVLGFISLLLSVFQGPAQKICVRESIMHHLLPCPLPPVRTDVLGGARRLLAGGGAADDYCLRKGKVPILSGEVIHKLHIFIFNLAVTHVVLNVLTFIIGVAQTRNWRQWEEKIQLNNDSGKEKDVVDPQMIKHVQEFQFIRDHFKGNGVGWKIFGWTRSFFKQFYGSVIEQDYTAMRLGFIMKQCKGHPKFNFYNYMIRAFEADFKKVVGIRLAHLGFANDILATECSWMACIHMVIIGSIHCLVLLVGLAAGLAGQLAGCKLVLLLVGTKMEHIITELAVEAAQNHTTIEGDVAVAPSDDFF